MSGFSAGARGNTEISDNRGSSVVYSGTATTTPANVPSSPGEVISGMSISTGLNDILVSFDGGTTFFTVSRRGFFSHNVKGEITQLVVKTLTGTSDYEILINFEDDNV